MLINDVVALDARAVRATLTLAGRTAPADLARPTPCAGWTLRDLLAHMTAQHRGFAAAAHGDASPGPWQPRDAGPDPVADYRDAAGTVLDAFAAPGILGRDFPLPEFPGSPSVPAGQAIGFHFLDCTVHAWDTARALGTAPPGLDAGLLAAALTAARAVPGGAHRLGPGAAFGPARPAPAGAGTLDRVVAALGRDPGWAPRA